MVTNEVLIGAREALGLSTAADAAKSMGIPRRVLESCEQMRIYPNRGIQEKICDFFVLQGYSVEGDSLVEQDIFPDILRERILSTSEVTENKMVYTEPRQEILVDKAGLLDRMENAGLKRRAILMVGLHGGLYGERLSYSDIAITLDTSESTVGRTIRSVIKQLKPSYS